MVKGGGRLTRDRVLKWVDIDGGPPEDPLVAITTHDDARAYVDACLKACNPAQFEALARLYFGVASRPHKGGSDNEPVAELQDDIRRLLDGVDTMHDFPETGQRYVDTPLPLHFPTSPNEWDTIQFLARNRTLIFRRGRHVANPMWGAYLWKLPEYPDDDADVHSLFQRHESSVRHRLLANRDRLLPVDIPVYKWGRRLEHRLLRFKSIVLTCRAVRDVLGSMCEFLMDGEDPFASRIVTGVFQINDVLESSFKMDKKWGDVRKAVRNELAQVSSPVAEWKRMVADANVYDSAALADLAEWDPRPTGRVNANVALYGGTRDTVVVDLAGDKQTMTKKRCMNYSSKQSAAIAIEAAEQGTRLLTHSVHQRLDFKRAGDRAQVLHAQRYNQVVVTQDRLMALYAYALGVRFILVRHRRPLIKEHPYHEAFTLVLGAGLV